jgi:prevent-host-death family protein
LQDAKNKLSEVVAAASEGQPQVVTRRGVDTAVIIGYDEYERMTRRKEAPIPPLSEYLLGIPLLAEGEPEIDRIALDLRDADL